MVSEQKLRNSDDRRSRDRRDGDRRMAWGHGRAQYIPAIALLALVGLMAGLTFGVVMSLIYT